MKIVTKVDIKQLYVPAKGSHKGQNGRLLIIGGSHLFHAASLWALKVASRIVDLVHYSSVPENNDLVMQLKAEFRDGIVVKRTDIETYIQEDDVILIGPGMMRVDTTHNSQFTIHSLGEIEKIPDEGTQTAALTNYLLKKYPYKQWVIDAGALQMFDVDLIPKNAILTPHQGEFEHLLAQDQMANIKYQREEIELIDQIKLFTKRHECIVLVKGEADVVCNGGESEGRICAPGECREIKGGNAGMTKGGTGDVLAGLVAALATKNPPFLATIAGAYINKLAGDNLFKKVGYYFNASDLADEIPRVMKKLIVR